MKAALSFAALLALLAIACQGGEEAPPGRTPTATVAPSPTATVALSPTPEVQQEPRLVFLRPQWDDPAQRVGVIHVSDLAGWNVIQLTPGDVRASFVGLAKGNGTATLYYIAAGEISNVFTLEARNLVTGETTTLASIEPAGFHLQSGSLSPDGRYVAFSHSDGIDLLDLTTSGRRRILTSNFEACGTRPPSECYGYVGPTWSPDGRLLLVQKILWETGAAVVVDPFQEAPQEAGQPLVGTYAPVAAWSPAGDAFCALGGVFEFTMGLYLSQQPEWQTRNLLPEYETYEPNAPLRNVTDCFWLDEHRIAFVTHAMPEPPSQESSMVSIYDLATAAVTPLADFGAEPPQLFPVAGSSTLVFNDPESGQPGLLNTTDGARTPILQAGDLVVAVTRPIALPEEIVAATPQVRPCAPLTAHCEAQVTNIAPERLNVREGANTTRDVIGNLAEGEIVCLTGSSQFGDGFRWWPVRSQGGLEGWVAQGDPQEPERPWLTPTRRKCEE